MGRPLDALDIALGIGVLIFGVVLAFHFRKKYRIEKLDFLFGTLYVAALASVLIAVYHYLRGLVLLSP